MSRSYITVTLNEFHFGIDVPLIREVNRSVDMTPVALAPPAIRGLMNLRGQIVTVLDPGICLNFPACSINNLTRCVVLKPLEEESRASINEIFGILVDNVGDIVAVEDKDLHHPPPNLNELDGKFIHHVVKLEKELLLILDMAKFLESVSCNNFA